MSVSQLIKIEGLGNYILIVCFFFDWTLNAACLYTRAIFLLPSFPPLSTSHSYLLPQARRDEAWNGHHQLQREGLSRTDLKVWAERNYRQAAYILWTSAILWSGTVHTQEEIVGVDMVIHAVLSLLTLFQFQTLLTYHKRNEAGLTLYAPMYPVALFLGPAQLAIACSTDCKRWKAGRGLGTRLQTASDGKLGGTWEQGYRLQAMESWAGPGNKAM